jgi:hypothetical protein
MVCWNDSITRSVELGGVIVVFMGECEPGLPFRFEKGGGVIPPDAADC